ncbi:MAG: 6-phosphogluconolactonase [Candidatus Levybacteria bacterium]|nr:6-phosphogluconolactonase [Candidatus Levybacteria bacterium]
MQDIFNSSQTVIREAKIHSYHNLGILICAVNNATSGLRLAGKILNSAVDKATVLFLSGGKTPKELYAQIAKEETLNPGAVGLVDERFGKPMHENSNEKMMKETGLLQYLKKTNVPLYLILQCHPGGRLRRPIGSLDSIASLQNDTNREETARRYEQQLRILHSTYRKHVTVLGIGVDGHTAGIPATSSLNLQGDALESWMEDLRSRSKNRMVIDYNDKGGFYKERITMTFTALSMMDLLIVLVFGKEKNHALKLLFSEGSEEEVSARFFRRPEIAKKTILITDQTI